MYLAVPISSLGCFSGSARDVQGFPAPLGVYPIESLLSFLRKLLSSFGLVHPLGRRTSLEIGGLDVRTNPPVELDGSAAAR